MPNLLSSLRIKRREFSSRRAVATGNAGVNHAAVKGRRAGDGISVLPSADLRLPHELAGFGIERDEPAVQITLKQFAIADGSAAIVPTAADSADVLVDAGFVLPDQS